MIVYATELSDRRDQQVGWGLKVVCAQYAAGSGVTPTYVSEPQQQAPDVWLVSLPYVGNVAHISSFFREVACVPILKRERTTRTVFILGGHAIVGTRQFLDIFDAVFSGEADDVGVAIGAAGANLDALSEIPGMDVTGRGRVTFQVASSLVHRGVYEAAPFDDEEDDQLCGSRPTVGRTHYLEVARGCRAGCRFCELGWAYGYTERTEDEVRAIAGSLRAPELVLSAPDTDGVSWLGDAISNARYVPRWRSTRIRPYLASQVAAPNGSHGRIRFGVEGITERLRKLTGKFMTNRDLYAAILRAKTEGYRMFRVFLMCGLPTETLADRVRIQDIIDIYKSADLRHWKAGDVKVTPLSPQPFTPWQRMGIRGSLEGRADIQRLVRIQRGREPLWRSVYVGAAGDDADVVKRMREPWQLPAYLSARASASVEVAASAAGFDWVRDVLDDMPQSAELPWSYIDHPHMARIRSGEAAWYAQQAKLDR